MTWTLPQKTDWMIKQMEHEPTRSYAQEIHEVVSEHPYKNALEIGCAWGVSTLAILLAGDGHLTSVDKDEYVKAPAEIEANQLGDRWRFKLMPSADFWRLNDKTYDLIYVDGSHLYEDVRVDLFGAWDALDKGGILFLDDIVHPANRKTDPKTMEMEYGVTFATMELIVNKKITQIGTTTRLLWTIK